MTDPTQAAPPPPHAARHEVPHEVPHQVPHRGVFRGALAMLAVALTLAVVPARATPAPDALRYTRLLHGWRLQAAGATVHRLPVTRLQQSYNDCALGIVAQLHLEAARAVPPRALLDTLFAIGPRGVSLDRLAVGLRTLGWRAAVVRVPSAANGAALTEGALTPPAIALVRPGHYVLVTRRTASHVEYFDPLVGQVRQPLARFAVGWSGKGVQLSARDN